MAAPISSGSVARRHRGLLAALESGHQARPRCGQHGHGHVPGLFHARVGADARYAKNLLPWSVVSRPLEGEAPTIDLAVVYSKSNTSPILKLFLSRFNELVGPNEKQ